MHNTIVKINCEIIPYNYIIQNILLFADNKLHSTYLQQYHTILKNNFYKIDIKISKVDNNIVNVFIKVFKYNHLLVNSVVFLTTWSIRPTISIIKIILKSFCNIALEIQ